MVVRKAELSDIPAITELASLLWPGHEPEQLREELTGILKKADAAFFLSEEEIPMGFAQCQLRHDYVEGTESSPVGYLEGIYVRPECRGRGTASKLLEAAQNWARKQGCREFASDCELTNTESLRFHVAMGFEEANRIICFTKKL